MMELGLSDKQQRVIASALTLLAVVFVLSITVFGLYWLIRFLGYFSNVFMPLAVAGIAALVMKPYYNWLYERCRHKPFLAVVLVYLSILIPIAAFGWFFGALLTEQVMGMVQKGSLLLRDAWAALIERWPEILEQARNEEWGARLETFLESRMGLISSGLWSFFQASASAGADVFRYVAGLFSWAIFPIYLGFFLAVRGVRREEAEEFLPFLRPELRKDMVYLGAEFVNILVSFFRGQLIVALLQGLLYALGFSIIGLQYGFVLGLLLGLLNIVPYLGSIIGLAVTIPLGLFQMDGGWSLVVGVVVVFTVVQTIESYVLTPRVMGDRTGLHPMAIIVAIFFWGTALGGIWGMILAIPLTAFGVVCWRLIKGKYIQEIS